MLNPKEPQPDLQAPVPMSLAPRLFRHAPNAAYWVPRSWSLLLMARC